MSNYEVIDEKRNMLKVRYKGIDTVGYRYKGDENPIEGSEPPEPDKDGQAAWAAQAKHEQTTDKGLIQERNDKGEFTDDYVYDPKQDEDEPDDAEPPEDVIADPEPEQTPENIIRETPFVERIFEPTEDISTTTSEVERQQRYGGMPYDEYLQVVETVIERLKSQTREVVDEYGDEIGIMWSVRYAAIGDSAVITNINHDELTYEVMIEDIIVEEDMSKRKTTMSVPASATLQLMLNEIPNEDSLPNEFRDAVEDIFKVVAEGSGDSLLVFQSVVEGWQYE